MRKQKSDTENEFLVTYGNSDLSRCRNASEISAAQARFQQTLQRAPKISASVTLVTAVTLWACCNQEVLRLRRLPVVPFPIQEEWFISWLSRSGALLGVRRAELLDALVIRHGSYIGSIWMTLADRHVVSVTRTCGLEEDALRSMLPDRYVGTAIGEQAVSAGRGANREWVGKARIAACPECLRSNGGSWLVSWRIAWSALCLDHRRYLASRCPSPDCRRRFRFPEVPASCHPWLRHRYWPWQHPLRDSSELPEPGSGQWCYPVREGSKGKVTCLFPASMAVAPQVEDAWMLDYQRVAGAHAAGVFGRDGRGGGSSI